MRVFSVVKALQLVCITFCLGTKSTTRLLDMDGLSLVAELELLGRADLTDLISIHCCRHQLGGHASWTLINVLARQTMVKDWILDGGLSSHLVN